MLVFFVILLSATVFADAAHLEKQYYSPEDAEMHFEYFMNTYQKQYESETEKKLRFEIFKQNLEKINQKNANPDQKYAVFGGIEGAYAIKHKELVSFSEQQLVSCDKTAFGCNGCSVLSKALDYLKNCSGLESEDDYPYEANDGYCKFDSTKVKTKITGYTNVSMDDNTSDEMVMQYLQAGPITIGLDASSWDFNYKGGILHCSFIVPDHAVLLVGYGTDEFSVPYWIVKNSWGSGWGESGFIRILRAGNACGFKNNYAVIPQVE